MNNYFKSVVLDVFPLRGYLDSRKVKKRIIRDTFESNQVISGKILENNPCLIARLGATEANSLRCILDSQDRFPKSILPSRLFSRMIMERRIKELRDNAGVYPIEAEVLSAFTAEYLSAMENADVFAAWAKGYTSIESIVSNNSNVTFVGHMTISPWITADASYLGGWSEALAGKKVLVVSPFSEEFKTQYKQINKVFKNAKFPEATFMFLKAPLTQGGKSDGLNWITHLNLLKDEIKRFDFDVALISAGSYALPLASFAKSMGKVGINCGGELQLFFGVTGGRWQADGKQKEFENEFWIRPFESSKPVNWKKIEDGCYW